MKKIFICVLMLIISCMTGCNRAKYTSAEAVVVSVSENGIYVRAADSSEELFDGGCYIDCSNAKDITGISADEKVIEDELDKFDIASLENGDVILINLTDAEVENAKAGSAGASQIALIEEN